MDPDIRLMLGTALVVVVTWVPFACFPSVSPATRDVLVRTALDEARYQCGTNPPNDARLQSACVALLSTDDGVADAGASKGNQDGSGPTTSDPAPAPSTSAPANVEQGNATRRVEDGGQ